MGFFEDIIKEASGGIKWDDRGVSIITPAEFAYLKVKSKYRGLEGKIYCMRPIGSTCWRTTHRSYIRAMNKIAYGGDDYLILTDKRATLIIVGKCEAIIE